MTTGSSVNSILLETQQGQGLGWSLGVFPGCQDKYDLICMVWADIKSHLKVM